MGGRGRVARLSLCEFPVGRRDSNDDFRCVKVNLRLVNFEGWYHRKLPDHYILLQFVGTLLACAEAREMPLVFFEAEISMDDHQPFLASGHSGDGRQAIGISIEMLIIGISTIEDASRFLRRHGWICPRVPGSSVISDRQANNLFALSRTNFYRTEMWTSNSSRTRTKQIALRVLSCYCKLYGSASSVSETSRCPTSCTDNT